MAKAAVAIDLDKLAKEYIDTDILLEELSLKHKIPEEVLEANFRSMPESNLKQGVLCLLDPIGGSDFSGELSRRCTLHYINSNATLRECAKDIHIDSRRYRLALDLSYLVSQELYDAYIKQKGIRKKSVDRFDAESVVMIAIYYLAGHSLPECAKRFRITCYSVRCALYQDLFVINRGLYFQLRKNIKMKYNRESDKINTKVSKLSDEEIRVFAEYFLSCAEGGFGYCAKQMGTTVDVFRSALTFRLPEIDVNLFEKVVLKLRSQSVLSHIST